MQSDFGVSAIHLNQRHCFESKLWRRVWTPELIDTIRVLDLLKCYSFNTPLINVPIHSSCPAGMRVNESERE